MTGNNPHSNLVDFIDVGKSIIPSFICHYIVSEAEKRNWRPHKWYSYGDDEFSVDKDKNQYIQNADSDLQGLLSPYIRQSLSDYASKNIFACQKIEGITSKFSNIVFNRYSQGHMLDQHQDHINALFDGKEKGIPILSMIINLNTDYEGGELFFWNDHTIQPGIGDIIIFPSLFLYPHGIKEIKSGKRYSGVSWAW